MMKQFDSRSNVLKRTASSEYEEEFEDSDLEEDDDLDSEEDDDSDSEEDDDSDLEEDDDSDLEEDDDSDLEEDDNSDLEENEDDDDSEYEDEEMDDDYSWKEAVKHHSVFYGNSVIIALICREKVNHNCERGVLIKPIKWKIATREGRKWTVVDEYPFNCDADAVFGEYGLPTEFQPVLGYYKDDEAIIP
jgi:hypothetical protein